MNRNHRARMGKETVEISRRGWYMTAAGQRVDITDAVAESVRRTSLFTPTTLEALLGQLSSTPTSTNLATKFEVRNETTLSAAHRLVVEQSCSRTLCLNFASAKNPGGGFLGGSQAQEESLARSSALYATLIADMTYYDLNRRCDSMLYTDHLILSPDVPVFRADDGTLLDTPYLVSFITAPAPNAGEFLKRQPDGATIVRETMARRIRNILAVALTERFRHLVLGAWGCGVFRNEPAEVARLFAKALTASGPFHGAFQSVTFAVLDGTPDGRIIQPFAECFAKS